MSTNTIINLFKENKGIIIWSIILLSLGIYHRDLFFIIVLAYTYIIKFLLADILKKKTRKNIAMSLLVFIGIFFVLVLYVNNFMPRGEMIDLTEYGCEPNRNREEYEDCYREDMRNLQIPEWAKILRSNWLVIEFALIGMAFASYYKEEDKEK